MYQEQRLERILMLLEERGNLSVKEMVEELGVSKDTIRRDFDCLSQRNLAQRTHGGILPVKNTSVLGFQEMEVNAFFATQDQGVVQRVGVDSDLLSQFL